MKITIRVFLVFLLFINASNVYACHCTNQIRDAFENLTNEVVEAIDAQEQAITKNKGLIDQIKKNISDIEEQNKVIEKLIEGEKRKALQNAEILFMIEKIIELKNTGEMR